MVADREEMADVFDDGVGVKMSSESAYAGNPYMLVFAGCSFAC